MLSSAGWRPTVLIRLGHWPRQIRRHQQRGKHCFTGSPTPQHCHCIPLPAAGGEDLHCSRSRGPGCAPPAPIMFGMMPPIGRCGGNWRCCIIICPPGAPPSLPSGGATVGACSVGRVKPCTTSRTARNMEQSPDWAATSLLRRISWFTCCATWQVQKHGRQVSGQVYSAKYSESRDVGQLHGRRSTPRRSPPFA